MKHQILYLMLWNKLQWNLNQITMIFSRKCIWKCCLQNGNHFCSGFNVLIVICFLTWKCLAAVLRPSSLSALWLAPIWLCRAAILKRTHTLSKDPDAMAVGNSECNHYKQLHAPNISQQDQQYSQGSIIITRPNIHVHGTYSYIHLSCVWPNVLGSWYCIQHCND